jgi:hypothetical protein
MAIVDPILGDPKFSDEKHHIHTKGNLVAWRKRYVLANYGPAGVDDVSRRLSETSKDVFLSPPTAFSWGPIGPMIDIDYAIVQGPMKGDVTKMFHFGAEIGTGDLSTIYKLVVRVGVSPKMLISRIPDMWRTYFRDLAGTLDTSESTNTRFTVKHFVLPYYLCSQGVTGWFTAGGLLTGAKDLTVAHDRCVHRGDPDCSWAFTW